MFRKRKILPLMLGVVLASPLAMAEISNLQSALADGYLILIHESEPGRYHAEELKVSKDGLRVEFRDGQVEMENRGACEGELQYGENSMVKMLLDCSKAGYGERLQIQIDMSEIESLAQMKAGKAPIKIKSYLGKWSPWVPRMLRKQEGPFYPPIPSHFLFNYSIYP